MFNAIQTQTTHGSMIRHLWLITILLILSGCASVNGPKQDYDPWEGFNRTVFNFNDKADRYVLKPIATGYHYITPDVVEKGIGNVFRNLGELNTILNDLLQAKFIQAANDTGRFLINSTIGLAGIFDVAKPLGLRPHQEDLGQTLAVWGVPDGPYLVLPLLGPSNIRDASARGVSTAYLNPLIYVEDDNPDFPAIEITLLSVINTRAQFLEASELLDDATDDPYIFMREGWRQRRENQIYDGNPPEEEYEIDIFSDD